MWPSFFLLITVVDVSWSLSTIRDQLLDQNGNPLFLKGANWFGFNNGQTMVDGLWNPADAFTYDFATIIYRWQLLGFNAIRLPFSMQNLYDVTPINKLSTQCGSIPTFEDIAYSVVDPSVSLAPNLTTFPLPPDWPPHSPNTCNQYLPEDTTLNRFVWVVQYLAHNGFYVIIDDHTEDPTVINSQSQFITNWVDIVTRISQDAVASQQLIVDILNEPDSRGWGWDVMSGLYLSVMDQVYPVNSNVLFFIEGCGQGGLNGANWGDGFQTTGEIILPPAGVVPESSDEIISEPGVVPESSDEIIPEPAVVPESSDEIIPEPGVVPESSGEVIPEPGSHQPLRLCSLQVVISPHVYGPTVTFATTNYFGSGLWNRLTKSFGYLTTSGYTFNGITKRFAVVIGETGSNFAAADASWRYWWPGGLHMVGEPLVLYQYMVGGEPLVLYQDIVGGEPLGLYQHIVGGEPLVLYQHMVGGEPLGLYQYMVGGLYQYMVGGEPLVLYQYMVGGYNIQWQKIEYLNVLGLTPWYQGQSSQPLPSTPQPPSSLPPASPPLIPSSSTSEPPAAPPSPSSSTSEPPAAPPSPSSSTSEPPVAPPSPTAATPPTAAEVIPSPTAGGSNDGGTSLSPPQLLLPPPSLSSLSSPPPLFPPTVLTTLNAPDASLSPPLVPPAAVTSAPQPTSPSPVEGYTSPLLQPSDVVGSNPYSPQSASGVGGSSFDSIQCEVSSQYGNIWNNGIWSTTALNLYVKNAGVTGNVIPPGWQFSMYNPTYQGQSGAWNFELTSFSQGNFLGLANQSWEYLQAGGDESVNIGLIVSSSEADFKPHMFTLNGASCQLF
ncbi:hypothetical protein CEUSTIGMA_g6398.t1 [Chlamydomonas eustigma]|uniref:cellulase n=1 Tax=Chlamydomonas eustigma TaxID=1157962 RepID=A0A250X7A0_9CHLO|nr:hypothetical protein CEUSTIGMA_g6398.t1 [Chlamydomonas eustigma]|eukprot:GAX78958.1 hypothetical protein CEUSTIGMA_g6398.t1 [Chlamydomonas eustigma]